MDISVVISTYNNSERLRISLGAFTHLRCPEGVDWELVLVNNNCSDETDQVAVEFSDRLPLVYIHEPRPGNCQGRNAGIRAASGKLIVFTDEDVKPAENWLKAYWSAYQQKPEGFYFGGPIESEFENAPPESELAELAPQSVNGLYYGAEPRGLEEGDDFIAPNWACPAADIRAAGGFDTSLGLDPARGRVLGGEETDLMERLRERGLLGWYVPEAKVKHFVPAHKCTLKHIAARVEAAAYYQARKMSDGAEPVVRISGVPRWLWRRATRLFCDWVFAKMRGRKAYREYVRWKWARGAIAYHREDFIRSIRHEVE